MSGTKRSVSWRRWLVGNPGNAPCRKCTGLRYEPLESRQLLSVSPLAVDDSYELNASGSLHVGSPHGALAVDESLPAGLTPDVIVNLAGGKVINNPSYAEMGGTVGAFGQANVAGAGSQWNITDWLEVGDSGQGRVNISDGGAVSVGNWVEISGNPGAVGYVDVAGLGSKWTIANHVSIGDDGGHGTLRVTNGGAVQSKAWAGIGRYAGSVGRVVVAGEGSIWQNNDYLGIGDGGLGDLTVADGGVVASGRIDNRSGGRIFGDGTLRAAVTNAGLIAPGASRGILKIEGSLLQAENGVIQFDITGTERGTQYDALDVTGGVIANGRAVLKFSNGFAPKAGDVFEVIHARESSGVFWDMRIENLMGPSPTEPLKFQFSWADGVLKMTILNDARYVAPPPPPAGSGVLDNDVDSQGDVLSAVLVERPAHGAVAMYANGGFLYTPDATFTGSDSFRYRANDGILDSNVATVTIVNLPPVAADDSYEALEDETLTIGVDWGVLGNDHDSVTPPYMLKAVLVDGPQHGTLSLAEDGSFTYQPAANYHGPDSFTYQASDGMLLSESATVALDVISVNDLPVVQPDYFSTTVNTPLVIQPAEVLANDSDVDGDVLIVDRALATADTHGTVGYTDDGILRYMPAAGFTGRASFTYVVWDGNGANNVVEGTVYVDVLPQNPVAEDDSYPLGANGRLDVDLLSGPGPVAEGTPGFPPYGLNADFVRTLAGGQQLVTGSASLGSQASSYGDVTITGKGSKWTLTEPMDWKGYLVVGDYGTARVTVTNGGALWTGSWTEIGQHTGASGYVDVSGAGSRWDDGLFLTVGDDGGHGSLRVTDGAVVNVADWTEVGENGATGRITVTGPGSVFTVQHWMEIAHNGGHGTLAISNGGVVQVMWQMHNYEGGQIIGDGTLKASLTNNGLIAPRGTLNLDGNLQQGAAGDIVFEIRGNERGTLYDALNITGGLQAGGRVVFRFADGYAPKAGDVFEPIMASSSSSAFGNMAIENLDPGFGYKFSLEEGVLRLTILSDTTYVGSNLQKFGVLVNDSDPDGHLLEAILVEPPKHGWLTLYANGSFSYVPGQDFTGTDSFKYQAGDGILTSDVATVSIYNLPPVANNDFYSLDEDTVLETTAANGVLRNDWDAVTPHAALKAVLVDGPKQGTLKLAADGSFSYQPAANYHGPDSFTYRTSDGMLLSEPATVALDVISVNDLPVVQPDYFSTTVGTPLVIQPADVLANDSDVDGDALIVDRAYATADTHGTVGYTDDGIIRYMPAAGFTGRASFTYVVWDGNGANDVVEGTVYVDVLPQTPVAEDDSYPLGANGRLDVDLLSGPVPVAEGTPGFPPYGMNADFVRTLAGGQQLVTGSASLGSQAASYGDVTITGQGSKWTVTDPIGWPGYLVVGDYGAARVTIADGGALWTGSWTEIGQNAGSSGYVDISGAGSRWDNGLFLSVGGGAGRGSLRVADGAVVNVADWTEIGEDGATGRVSVAGPGSVLTVHNWMEIAHDGGHGTLAISDGGVVQTMGWMQNYQGGQIIGDGTLKASLTNDGLIAPRGTLKLQGNLQQGANGDIVFEIRGNERGTLYDALNITGGLQAGGRVVFRFVDGYAPKAGEVFEPIVAGWSSGNFGNMAIENLDPGYGYKFSLENGVLRLTILSDTTYVGPTPQKYGVLANDSDPDGHLLEAILVEPPKHGWLTLYANGSFSYVPGDDFTGMDSFKYQAGDGILTSNVATVSIYNLPPVANNDFYALDEDTVLQTTAANGVLRNDWDAVTPHSALTAVLVDGPKHGTLNLAADGSFTYQPGADYYGTDSFTYQADDGTVRSSAGTVRLTIRPINDPPQANPDDKSTDQDTPLAFSAADLAANDTDPEGNTLTVTAVAATDDTHGTVELVEGIVTYTPAAGFSGAASFAYTLSDGNGGLATGTVNVTVNALNHPPVANPDSKSTDQGKALYIPAPELAANDTDPDGDPLTVTAVAATDQTHGTVSLGRGVVTYTPAADFSGVASFAYTVRDSHGAVATGTVSVTVNPVTQIVPGTVKGLGTLDDGRREFDFSVKANLTGHGMAYAGQLYFDDIRRGLAFRATSITQVQISADGTKATITGTGKLNGVRGYTFTVQVEDRTAAGKLDKFRIQIAGRRFKYDSLDYAQHNGRIDADGVIQIRRSPRRLPPTAIIRATDAAIESLPAMPSALWHRR